MKHCIVIIVLGALLGSSCSTSTGDRVISEAESKRIEKEIIEATDAFALAHDRIDVKAIQDFWHYDDPRWVAVENNVMVPAEYLKDMISDFYSERVDSVNMNWVTRDILPLTPVKAHLYGEFNLYMKYRSGDETRLYIHISALMKDMNGSWGAIRVHESYDE